MASESWYRINLLDLGEYPRLCRTRPDLALPCSLMQSIRRRADPSLLLIVWEAINQLYSPTMTPQSQTAAHHISTKPQPFSPPSILPATCMVGGRIVDRSARRIEGGKENWYPGVLHCQRKVHSGNSRSLIESQEGSKVEKTSGTQTFRVVKEGHI